jgi:hypothetical protein
MSFAHMTVLAPLDLLNKSANLPIFKTSEYGHQSNRRHSHLSSCKLPTDDGKNMEHAGTNVASVAQFSKFAHPSCFYY